MARLVFNDKTFKIVVGLVVILTLVSLTFMMANSEYNYVGEIGTEDEEYSDNYDKEQHEPDEEVVQFDAGFKEYGSVWTIPEATFRMSKFWDDGYWDFTIWEEQNWDMTVSIPHLSFDFNFDAFGGGILPDFFGDLGNMRTVFDDAPQPVYYLMWVFVGVFIVGMSMTFISSLDISI